MTWQPTGDDTVTSYRIECKTGGVSPVETFVNGSASKAVVGPLNTNGEQYTCAVFAVNAFGDSEGAESNNFTTG